MKKLQLVDIILMLYHLGRADMSFERCGKNNLLPITLNSAQ
jgi:hypothetical protein